MRLHALVAITLLFSACPASQTRTEGVTAVGKSAEPRKVELVQDQPVNVGDGVSVTLKTVMYSHGTDKSGRSVNDAFMQLEVTQAGKTESVTLTRLFPDGPRYTTVAGLSLAIDYVDAYHQPCTGVVLVAPKQP
jgi:hypothetical protein